LGRNFRKAIKLKNPVWEQIKENEMEDETKLKCRKRMTEALRKEGNLDDSSYFTRILTISDIMEE
jgi:hypothetical protein